MTLGSFGSQIRPQTAEVFKPAECQSRSVWLHTRIIKHSWLIMAFIPVTTIASVFILLFCLTIQVQSLFLVQPTGQENDRPIVGILSQELSYRMTKIYRVDQFESYIAASYVKYVESAGARVVPIWIGQPESYYRNILSRINGVLLPGGSSCFDRPGGYSEAGRIIYRIAKEMNDHGDYFPIWGTCLGFELLTYLEADGIEHRTNCSSNNQILPLTFKPDFLESRMFENAPNDVINILKEENVTANFHHFCVTEEDLRRVNLMKTLRVMSVNRDKYGLEFVSSVEHFKYPFYATQFHPEKNNYEWIPRLIIPHTRNSIRVSQYFADFFIDEVRKNQHRFETHEEENRNLIYNYAPEYTGYQPKSSFEQCYFFEKISGGIDESRAEYD